MHTCTSKRKEKERFLNGNTIAFRFSNTMWSARAYSFKNTIWSTSEQADRFTYIKVTFSLDGNLNHETWRSCILGLEKSE